MQTKFNNNSQIWQGKAGTFVNDFSITINLLNRQSLLHNRAYILTRKPSQNGRIKVTVGPRYSRIIGV